MYRVESAIPAYIIYSKLSTIVKERKKKEKHSSLLFRNLLDKEEHF